MRRPLEMMQLVRAVEVLADLAVSAGVRLLSGPGPDISPRGAGSVDVAVGDEAQRELSIAEMRYGSPWVVELVEAVRPLFAPGAGAVAAVYVGKKSVDDVMKGPGQSALVQWLAVCISKSARAHLLEELAGAGPAAKVTLDIPPTTLQNSANLAESLTDLPALLPVPEQLEAIAPLFIAGVSLVVTPI